MKNFQQKLYNRAVNRLNLTGFKNLLGLQNLAQKP